MPSTFTFRNVSVPIGTPFVCYHEILSWIFNCQLTLWSAMREENTTADRLAAYSDAFFAVIVTIMVLELKAPDQPGFLSLQPLWPTAISYAVSYLFIAIIWINHDYLMRFVGRPPLRLIWINFVHLFMVSFLPFATAWIARTRIA